KRRAAIRADEVKRRLRKADRPRERQRKEAAHVGVRRLVGESPGMRADDGFQDGAAPQCAPERLTPLGKPKLSDLAWHQFVARIPRHPDAHDLDVELVAVL